MKTLQIFITIIILCIIGFAIYLSLLPVLPAWTGFGESIKDETKEAAKTLWDWLDLLIIPAVIGLLGWLYSQTEKIKTKKRDEERSQNEVLESFLLTMTNLIIEHKLHDTPNRQILSIARARINIALHNLNGSRKGQVLQFLYESDLIDLTPKINLIGINFQNVVIDEIVLGKSEIKGSYFNNSSIQKANLSGGVFIGCDFSDANLSQSLVTNTDFSYSNFTNAILNNMDLTSVNLEGVNLTNANLRGSKISKVQLENIYDKERIKTTKKLVI